MNYEINKNYDENELKQILNNFDNSGIFVADGRNKIKKFKLKNGKEINIKKFKKKDIVTQWIYKNFKGSKAKRSFEYANMLLKLNINTPEPIAFFDNFGVEKSSYYISEELKYDFTCREVLWDDEGILEKIMEKVLPYRDEIIKQFAKFTFKLHENGVRFDDYSPGNVLIKKNGEKYEFYLIDLNRMAFLKNLSFSERMKNVSRMMENKEYVEKFSKEYSKYCKKDEKEVFNKLYYFVKKHRFYVFLKDSTRSFRYFFKK